MRSNLIVEEGYYHICGKGQRGQHIFKTEKDYDRFLLLILLLQGDSSFRNFSRLVNKFTRAKNISPVLSTIVDEDEIKEILVTRKVKLLNFTMMPNHYHLTLQNLSKEGISDYMHRILVAYSKYFNTKYDTSGHVFNGPYRIKSIEEDNYLIYASAYIHRNVSELKNYHNNEVDYYWSSYKDYVKENRWGSLLETIPILEHFESSKEYENFIRESGAKYELDQDWF